ncbi:MAG: putative membrane protein, partial [Saprospiraceae bacterium]
MLTKSGWFTATAIALLIIASGLTVYLIYPFAFLILGSLVSKLNPKNEDNSGRTSMQVIANSGIAGLISFLYLLTQDPIFLVAFVVSFSVAFSDTFSSEIGKKYGG